MGEMKHIQTPQPPRRGGFRLQVFMLVRPGQINQNGEDERSCQAIPRRSQGGKERKEREDGAASSSACEQ